MSTSAKTVADSISESGQRITTMVLEYPRIIHAEFMTHRMFSRNASSSRAIPVEKQIERIESEGFIPLQFGANKKGMQAGEDLNPYESQKAEHEWREAKRMATAQSWKLNKIGVHKQLANRLLEPFSHIQVVVTATEWDNFFAQRLHPAAQPEIQELAKVMKEAMDTSTPTDLRMHQWHLPFTSTQDWDYAYSEEAGDEHEIDILRKLSVARCARVSYGLNERGWGDIEKDLALYDMLYTSGHWSPFEHQATPMVSSNVELLMEGKHFSKGVTHVDRNDEYWSGNFKGWIQNRQLIQQQ